MSSIRVLGARLDTVELSFIGQFSEDAITRLDQAKSSAAVSGEPKPMMLGAAEMMMTPKAFSFWRWRLNETRFAIVGKPKAASGAPTLMVSIHSFGLANEPLKELYAYIRYVISDLGDFTPLAISRADVCVDFQGWTPTPTDMANIVCPASYRATHGTSEQVQTFQFGKSTLLRVYNKTAEIEVSKKYWLRDLWRQSDAYDPQESVWRVEYQARSDALRSVGYTSAEQLFDAPGALLDCGLRWAQLRVPSADSTKTRWAEDQRWTALREAVFGGIPLQRRTNPAQIMDLDGAISRFIGLAALAGARFDTTDYIEAIQRLSIAAEAHMMREGIDFAALVEAKRRRLTAEGV